AYDAFPSLQARARSDRTGSPVPPVKTRHRTCVWPWLSESFVHDTQENRWPPASPEPQAAQQVCRTSVFQNGDRQNGMFHAPEERLPDIHRSDRCLSSCLDRSFSQEVPPVPMARQSIPVPDATIRTFSVPSGIHQDPTAHPALGQTEGDPPVSIPRRSSDNGTIKGTVERVHTPCSGETSVPRILDQREEVLVDSVEDPGPPRL